MLPYSIDIVVVGAGNAAFCAALAAAESNVSVLMLERSSEEESGGNSRFTAGAIRCVYEGVEDLKALMPDLSENEIATTDFGSYTEEKFFDDMGRVTEYRTDPDLCELLVRRSRDTIRWMRDKGVRFQPIYGRQAFKVDGKFKFWGGLTVEAWGGGPGLVEALTTSAKKNSVTVAYQARARSAEIEGFSRLGLLEYRAHLFSHRSAQSFPDRFQLVWDYLTLQRGARLIIGSFPLFTRSPASQPENRSEAGINPEHRSKQGTQVQG